MALDFPANPTNGQTFGNYIYDTSIPGWRNVNSGEGVGLQFKSGLVPITPASVTVTSGSATVATNGEITMSSAAGIKLNGIFTSAYKSYKILISNMRAHTGSATVYSRLLDSAGNAQASAYYLGGMIAYGGSSLVWNDVNVGALWIHNVIDLGTFGAINFDVHSPQLASITEFQLQYSGWGGGVNRNGAVGGFCDTSGQYSSIYIYADVQSLSATIRIYGYN